jgi:hypothetical protein
MTDIFKDVSVQPTNTDADPSIDTTLPDHGLKDFPSECPVRYIQDVHGLHETADSIKAAQLENITSPVTGSDPFTKDTDQCQANDLTQDEPRQKKPATRHLWGNLRNAEIYIKQRKLNMGQNHCVQQVLTYFTKVA